MTNAPCRVCSLVHSPICDHKPTWPIRPLLDLAPDGITREDLSRLIGASHETIEACKVYGCSDLQADRWACRLGYHPSLIWPDWFDAGLTVVDAQFVQSGWRTAWLYSPTQRKAAA